MPALPSAMPETETSSAAPSEIDRLRDFEATHRVVPPAVPVTYSWANERGETGSFPGPTSSAAPAPSIPAPPPATGSHFPLLEAAAELGREGIARATEKITKATDFVDAADNLRSLLDKHLDSTRASRVQIEDGIVELVEKLGLDANRIRRQLTPPAPLA